VEALLADTVGMLREDLPAVLPPALQQGGEAGAEDLVQLERRVQAHRRQQIDGLRELLRWAPGAGRAEAGQAP
jgi:hypothetical protein